MGPPRERNQGRILFTFPSKVSDLNAESNAYLLKFADNFGA